MDLALLCIEKPELVIESLCLPPKFLLLLLELPLLLLNSCSKGLDIVCRRSGSEGRSALAQQYEADRHKQTYPAAPTPVSTWDQRVCSHRLPLGIRFESVWETKLPEFCNVVERYRQCNCCADSACVPALLRIFDKNRFNSCVRRWQSLAAVIFARHSPDCASLPWQVAPPDQ